MKPRVVILISGRGSNMRSILDSSADPAYPAQVVGIVSNRRDASGLALAAQAGIETRLVDHTQFETKKAFETELLARTKDFRPDIVCLAGFMRILSTEFISQFQPYILNIHPSILPKYKGLNTHQRAIDAGEEKHGCSVHRVSEAVDGGQVLGHAELRIQKGETASALAKRVLTLEHKLYPKIIAQQARRIAKAKKSTLPEPASM